MACNNCFNGCTDITPDKCIKYTGATISSFGITSGDTLLSVINNLTSNLQSSLDGTGIVPTIDSEVICSLITPYLPSSGDVTIVDYITALILAICNLQEQVTGNTDDFTALNADYAISCLSGVTSSSDTHDVVQAIITKLCSLNTSFSSLVTDLPSTYVSLDDLNTLIQTYLDSISSSTAIKNKMVPYTAVEYYGPLTYFDLTGAGTGDWADIYLCNGNNGTPDKRGRVPVGTTTGMGGGAFDSEVDPTISGNPTYALYTTNGENNVTLTEAQMPSHVHATEVTVTNEDHFHYEFNTSITTGGVNPTSSNYALNGSSSGASYQIQGNDIAPTLIKSSTASVAATTEVTNPSVGDDNSHNNIQPVIACHYIMYIPS